MNPQDWLIGVTRRSVEKDYRFYDPPLEVWRKINHDKWNYKRDIELVKRDLALMCVLYISCSRVSEIVRANFFNQHKPSITKDQFVQIGKFLMLRRVPVIKHKVNPVTYKDIKRIEDYPFRFEVPFPLEGELTLFTTPIQNYLATLTDNQELFPFKRSRAFQIVHKCSTEFPHYLREMGLRLWLRLFSKDLVQLKGFSGHRRLENLARYLATDWTEATPRLLNVKLGEI